jgi:hypothetical protein
MGQQLISAVQFAIKGDWHAAHNIAQNYDTPIACWIHAVLHKIEPDEWNSKYWYARSGGHTYLDYVEPSEELNVIANYLTQRIK